MHPTFSVASKRKAGSPLRAFTILEILIVITIIGMLVGLLVGNLDKFFGDSKVSMAEIFCKSSVKLPLQSYSMHMGDVPSTAEGLQALITPPSGRADRWRGPYLQDGKMPLDPWNEPYQYRSPATKAKQSYDVWSKGPDKQDGTPDDVGNW